MPFSQLRRMEDRGFLFIGEISLLPLLNQIFDAFYKLLISSANRISSRAFSELCARLILQKGTAIKVLESLPEFFLSVHYDRAVPGDWLPERLS